MLIYNTLTKQKEEFKPINSPKVTMYVCGPTVYDFFHIGNGRTFIMADVIRKYLIYKGYDVQFAMNLTDIDDKIIKKANDLKKETNEISQTFSDAFLEDIQKLNIKKADIYPKATENIEDIIDMITKLVEEDYAYEVDGNVFYNVEKFEEYGKLSGKKIDELEAGSRIEVNDQKKNPLDFALWKKTKEGEPFWASPWGKGRPGWHIECSAMSTKYLGKNIDIHAGGSDLIFPHHENEIAQSEAVNKTRFVNYWIHFGFLNIQNEKMSKSLGNFFTAREILKKYSAEAIRLLFLQTHYAGPLNFSEELMNAAEKGLEKIRNTAQKINEGIEKSSENGNSKFDFETFRRQFVEVMDDDFNTPRAVAVLFDFIRAFNSFIAVENDPGSEFYVEAKRFMEGIAQEIFGIVNFDEVEPDIHNSLESELIEILIDIRQSAKQNKNYELADSIRQRLNDIGVELQDSKDGTVFRRK